MSQKLKNLLKFKSLKKSAIFITLLLFVVLGLLLPFHLTLASVAAVAGGYAAVLVKLLMVVAITGGLVDFAIALLEFAISPHYVSLPYTSGGIVDIGWPFVQDLANMILVIILVFIGLATTLKIKDYEAKKTLPILIIVGLLINFSKVILGLVIDAGNILMNFFLVARAGIWGEFSGMIMYYVESFIRAHEGLGVAGLLLKPIVELITGAVIIKAVLIIILNLLLFLVILLFAFIFFARPIALWILVIFSPLALVFYILPGTRSYFYFWLNQIIQWSFIGVILAFFLYLTSHLLANLQKADFPKPEVGTLGLFNELIPLFGIFFFMFFGLLISLSTSAVGAKTIIEASKKGAKKYGKLAALTAGAMAGSVIRKKWETSPIAEKIREKAMALAMKTPPTTPTWGQNIPGRKGWFLRQGAEAYKGAAVSIWALGRLAGEKIGPSFKTSQQARIDEAEKKAEKWSVEEVIPKLRSPLLDWATKIGYLNRLVKRGNIDEALDKGLLFEEIVPAIKEAEKYDAHMDIVSALPQLMGARMQAIADSDKISLAEAYNNEIFSRMRPDRAAYLSRRIYERTGSIHRASNTQDFKNPEILEAMVRNWAGDRVSNFLNTHQIEGARAIEDRIKQLAADEGKTPEEWLKENNLPLFRYIRQGKGRGLFSI